ncbi:MAG: putative metal-dependent amidase/aminoacylase/carboxypeptidase [Anaerosporomusa subterranea]|jgi:amidohydrolase|nr:putative metal-dependent amidase/aminoacylase/carboxypeptidase [Anaerosporomusa subterranea]
MKYFQDSIDAVIPKVKEWRRHFHQYPEPSFEEFKTTEYIIEQIKDLSGLTYERISSTGIVARLNGAKPGPVIALRADIDALRMPENSGLPFASRHEGIMHACGHDAHAAMLLGALFVLYEHRKELSGEFVFIFQAAEELFPGGAKALVEKGVMDGVDAIIGQHADTKIKAGHIGSRPGYITANSDAFDLTVIGRGGHASTPQLCLDPLPVGAQIVTALQDIVARRIPAKEQVVLSVTQFHSGTAHNIIPDTAVIKGSVRTYSQENRESVKQAIGQIAAKYAEAFDMRIEYTYHYGYDTTYNTPEFAEAVMAVADELYGSGTAELMDPILGGEDFSYYLQKAPGCFYFFGVRNEELDCIYPAHNTKFCIDEDAFTVGISVMLNAAIRFQSLLQKKSGEGNNGTGI